MIKASGYGTGLIESAKVLEQNKADYYTKTSHTCLHHQTERPKHIRDHS